MDSLLDVSPLEVTYVDKDKDGGQENAAYKNKIR